MSHANEMLLQQFVSPNHTLLFESSRLVGSLNGTSFRFNRHSDDSTRFSVLEERRNVIKILAHIWQEILVPAASSPEFSSKEKSLLKACVHTTQLLPLIVSTPHFTPLAQAFADHLSTQSAKNADNAVGPEDVPLLNGPISRTPSWDTSDPMALWSDAAEDDFVYNMLRSQRRAFLFNQIDDLEESPYAHEILLGFGAMLNENVAFYDQLVETFAAAGFENTLTKNAFYAFGSGNLSADERTALAFVVGMSAGYEHSWGHVETMLQGAIGSEFKIRCDFLDQIMGVKTGSSFKILKAGGVLDAAKWLDRSRDSKDWKVSESMLTTYVRALRYPSSSSEDFFKQITSETLVELNTSSALAASHFEFLGRDWTNLVVAFQSSKPLKVLVSGKPGNGKSALVSAALAHAQRSAVTIDVQDEFDFNADLITTVRQSIASMGHPIFVVDPMDMLLKSPSLVNMFNSPSAKATAASEVWVVSDIKRLPQEVINAFDLVVDVPTLPLAQRQQMARDLFNDSALADKVSKSCATPGEIVKLHEWSVLSGQSDWSSLSVKALATQQAALKAGTSNADLPITLFQPAENNKGFESVVGNAHVVKEARKAIIGFRDPQRFRKIGATPPKGLLLTGGPGTGKTHLVRAMAHEAGVPLLVASSAALASNPVLISSVFSEARRQSPCILFLDEIDAIGASADNQNGASADPVRQSILNRLLVEINGFEDLENVMVIGATHRPHVLDAALTRSGRLGWNIDFEMPERAQRQELWEYYSVDLQTQGVQWERAARLSSGMSPADIAEAVKIAAMNAAMEDQEYITMSDIVKAIDAVGWSENGPERNVRESDLRDTAVHECGHALLAWVYKMDIDRISIKPTGNALGYVRHLADEDKLSYSITDMENHVAMTLGGLIAEEIVLKRRSMGASSDLRQVRKLVSRMYREEGVGSYVGGVDWPTASEALKAQVELEEQNKIKEIKDNTTKLLLSSSQILTMLSSQLVKDREISGDEMDAWMRAKGFTRESILKVAAQAEDKPLPVRPINGPKTKVAKQKS